MMLSFPFVIPLLGPCDFFHRTSLPIQRRFVAASKLPASIRAFRHRNYQLFFSGQLISVTGTWMQSVAESWLVYRLTGSAALLGVTAFCSQIPVFVLAPVAGTVADRNNRHRIMVITQSISMVLPLVLCVLTFTGVVRPWHVFVLAG